MSVSQELNRAIGAMRLHGWVAALHDARGFVIGVGTGECKVSFPVWYADQAQEAVEKQGAVVVLWLNGQPSQTIAVPGDWKGVAV